MQQLFDRHYLTRAIVAGTVGSSIEFYDFVLSANAAILVFPRVFFPHSNPLGGILIAFSTYSAGFITRPLGAAFFGHFGDRLGRKSTLVATLFTMGLVSAGIGLLPGYAQIGIWGGIILTVLRLLQGFAIGGEWGGTILLPIEWGPPERRGFVGSWPHLGFPSGLLTATWRSSPAPRCWGPRPTPRGAGGSAACSAPSWSSSGSTCALASSRRRRSPGCWRSAGRSAGRSPRSSTATGGRSCWPPSRCSPCSSPSTCGRPSRSPTGPGR